ncbi:YncE family protein [Undibacterium arcticum]
MEKWLYVSAEEADSIDIIDVSKRQQVASVTLGMRPRGIAFKPDGSQVYIAAEIASMIYAVDVGTQKVVAQIKGGNFFRMASPWPRMGAGSIYRMAKTARYR